MRAHRVLAVIVVVLVLAGGSLGAALGARLGGSPVCTTSWSNTSASGSFTVAGNWTNGAPVSGVDACLPAGNYTVTVPAGLTEVGSLVIGSSGAAQEPTLRLSASQAGGGVHLVADNGPGTYGVENFGTIELTDPDPAGATSATAEFQIAAGTLANDGTIESTGATGTFGLDGNVENNSDGTVDVESNLLVEVSATTGVDTFETSGTINISSGQELLVGCNQTACNDYAPTLTIDGGTISNEGAFQIGLDGGGATGLGATLNINGGTLTGNPLAAVGKAVFAGAGSGSFTLEGTGGLSGTIGSGDTVAVTATSTIQTSYDTSAGLTNDGTLELAGASASTAPYDELQSTSGTLTNDGTIIAEAGAGGSLGIDGNVKNDSDGTIDVQSDLLVEVRAQTGLDTFETDGTINVSSGQDLLVGCNQTACNDYPATFTIDGGTISNEGALQLGVTAAGRTAFGGTLSVNGGTLTGDPIVANPQDATFTGAGSGSFTILDGGKVSGTLGPDDALTLQIPPNGNSSVTATAGFVNEGTIDIPAGNTLNTSTATNESGSITDAGTLTSTGAFTEVNGSVTGGAVQLDGTKLSLEGTGASSFLVEAGSSLALSGNIAADQTLTIDDVGGFCGGTIVNDSAALTNAGTIAFEANGCPSGPAELVDAAGLTNTGAISFAQTAGGAGEVDGPLINEYSGTVTVADKGDGVVAGTMTNDGTLAVSGGTLHLSGGLTNFDALTDTLSGGLYEVIGSAADPATLDLGPFSAGTAIDTVAASIEIGAHASVFPVSAVTVDKIAEGGEVTFDQGAATTTLVPFVQPFVNDGSLQLGPGVQLAATSYTQGATGSLSVGIDAAPGSGASGSVDASGDASLAGNLGILDEGGFTPTSGDSYTAVTAGSVSGTFGAVTGADVGGSLAYGVAYGPASVTLNVATGVTLTTSAVTAPAAATVGRPLTVTWQVTAGNAGASGSWTDAVYLAPGSTLTPRAVLVGTTTHSGGLSAGGSYGGSLTAVLPGVLPGNWHVVVVADAGDEAVDVDPTLATAASGAVAVTQTDLAVGSQVSGTIPAGGDTYVEVTPAAGTNLALTATFPAASSGELFASFGSVPSPAHHDEAAADLSSAAQAITIAGTQNGAYDIDLDNPTSTPQSFTLAAAAPTVAITSVSPGTVTDDVSATSQSDINATIRGVGFTPTSGASLECTGLAPGANSGTFAATSVTFVSSTELWADFAPISSLSGSCTMIVGSGNASAQLAGAVAFSFSGGLIECDAGDCSQQADQNPQTPQVSIQAPSINRPDVDSDVLVTYSNPYDYPIPAPLMALDATGATLHYTSQPAGVTSSLLLLGTAPTGDPSVLEPGETGTIVVAFDSTAGVHGTVDFAVNTLSNPAANIDLGDVLSGLLPADVSPALASYVASSAGVTTGAALQAKLDADARYLASIGEPTSNAELLLGYELNKLTNDGQAVVDHTDGPFGYGLPGLVDTASVDSSGDVTVSDPAGDSTTFVLEPAGGYAPPPGVQSSLASAPNGGWVMSQPDESTVTFDASGRLVSSADGYGNTTTYSYAAGNLTSVSLPDGATVTIDYNAANLVSSMADSSTGQTTSYTYDATGRLASVSTGATTEELTWNASADAAVDGTLASITDPAGVTTSYAYNSQGEPTSVTRDGTVVDSYAYPSSGTVAITNALGQTTTEELDAEGSVAREVLADGTVLTHDLNALGQPTVISIAGASTQLGYDSSGALTSQIDPAGNETTYGYSSAGMLSSITQPNGLQWLTATDAQGDPTTITDPAGNTTALAYTGAGQVAELTDRDGNTVGHTYDAAGQLTSITLPGGGVESFGYDARHNLTSATNAAGTTSYTYSAADQLTGVSYPNGLGITYTYDAAGRRASETTSDGYQVNYHYDAAGNISSLTNGSGATIVSYTYDGLGEPTVATNGNGTTTHYTYTSRGAVASVVNQAPDGSTSSAYSYTYNALGETTSVTSSAGTTTYQYDAAGELTQAVLPDGRTVTYSYDAAGNRTASDDTAGSSSTYTLGPDDEYTGSGGTTYTYDKDGNLKTSTDTAGTTTYTWNALGQLTGAAGPSGTITYAYDALGNPITENVNGATRNLLLDPGSGTILGQYNTGGTPLDYYPYGVGTVGQTNDSGQTSYYAFDGQGNITALTSATGMTTATYSYLPFGEPTGTTGPPAPLYGYEGQYGIATDPITGFTHNGARQYDPTTGRFVSQDTTLTAAPNPYEYADNNPNDNIDPTGHDDCPEESATNQAIGVGLAGGAGILATGAGVLDYNAHVLNAPGSPFLSEGFDDLAEDTEAGAQNLEGAATSLDVLDEGREAYNNVNCALEAKNPLDRYKAEGNATVNVLNGVLEAVTAPLPFKVLLIHGTEKIYDKASQGLFDSFFYLYYQKYDVNVFGPAVLGPKSSTRSSHDPNDMVGPSGYGPQGFVPGGTPLPYEVDFSNLASASLPAQTVTVTEPVDPNVDLSTFSLGAFGFADHVVTPPPGLRSYETVIDDTAVSGLDVRVKAALDTASRTVVWTFTSLDPGTGLPTTNAAAGFLPPDVTQPEGEGFVSYDATPSASASTGTSISAGATVQFDENPPMDTATVINTVDDSVPAATINELPASETGPFTLSWAGADPGGSGVATYNVYISDNGGPFVPLETETTDSSTTFTGTVGDTYQFVADATSNVGTVQPLPSAAQAQTTIGAPGTGTGAGTTTTTATTTATTATGTTSTGSGTTTTGSPSTGTAPAPQPDLALDSTSIKTTGSRIPLRLSCSRATCAGSILLTASVVVTTHKGRRTIRRRERIICAQARYSLAAGQVVTTELTLTRRGRSALQATHGRLELTATVTLTGGAPATYTVTLRLARAGSRAGTKREA
jgi:RHS repeat-associated protein